MPRNPSTGVFTRVSNSFSEPVLDTPVDPTDADLYFDDVDGGITDSVAPPASSTDDALARFDGVTGKFVQDSGATLDDSDNLIVPGMITSNTAYEENSTTDHAFTLKARTNVALAYSVPVFRSKKTNSLTALDIWTNGTPTEDPSNGYTWVDACDADLTDNELTPIRCARIAMTSTSARFGMVNFNGATETPLEFIIGSGGGPSTIKASISTAGLLKVGTGTDASVFGTHLLLNGDSPTSMSVRNSTDHSEFFASASTSIFFGSATNHNLVFRTNNVTRATLNTSGDLNGLLSVTRTGGVSIEGTNTNDDAAAGRVGEYISSSVVAGAAVALTTATPANVTSISLTAGDWVVTAQAYITMATTTSYTNVNYSISSTSATQDVTPGKWINFQTPAAVIGNTHITFGAVTYRVKLASTTTIYLVAQSAFTVSTAAAWGFIGARRAR